MDKLIKVARWIDYRLPFFSFLDHELREYPTPRNLNYWWNFGSLAGITLVIMIVSGIFLAMHYEPNTNLAFDSVEYIMRNSTFDPNIYVYSDWPVFFLYTTFAMASVHRCAPLY